MILEVALRAGAMRRVDVQPVGREMHITLDGRTSTVRLEPLVGSEWWRLEVDGVAMPVRIHAGRSAHGGRPGDARTGTILSVHINASRLPLEIRRWLPVRSARRARAGAGEHRIDVHAPMPGLVRAVPLAPGDEVAAGQAVAVVEAMKMQMDVPAPVAGRIEHVRVRPGQEVGAGDVLVVLRVARVDEGEVSDS